MTTAPRTGYFIIGMCLDRRGDRLFVRNLHVWTGERWEPRHSAESPGCHSRSIAYQWWEEAIQAAEGERGPALDVLELNYQSERYARTLETHTVG